MPSISKKTTITLLLFLSVLTQTHSQKIETLKQQIEHIVNSKNAVVGVAITGNQAKDTLSINGQEHFPMQSVFKFPIALKILSEIDKGKFSLDQKINIKKSELLPGLWSPLREKHPEGGFFTIAELIKYTVALSDNAGCDALLRLLGKPEAVEDYFHGLGFQDFAVKINEETMQNNWDMQFLNWTTPTEANAFLNAFYENKTGLLSQENHDFIWEVMKSTRTGKKRLRGQLPKETVVAHKTGWSGKHKKTGVTAAANDIGIVFLPNENYFTISVFVSESTESTETNEKIIADICKAAWDYFTKSKS
ncbi:MAG: class A beta-lactamase, subclass A2 [Bacteroidota bacterium]